MLNDRSGKGQTHPPPGSAPTTSAGPMASSAVAIPPSKLSSMQAEDSKEDGKSVGSDAGSDDGRKFNPPSSPSVFLSRRDGNLISFGV